MAEIILQVHIISLFFSVAGILIADKMALSWFTGKTPLLDPIKLRRSHYHVIIGLTLMIITGALLFIPARDYLVNDYRFILKMMFVGIIILNSFIIGSLMNVAVKRTYAELSLREKIPLFASGGLSFAGWIGAIAMSLILF